MVRVSLLFIFIACYHQIGSVHADGLANFLDKQLATSQFLYADSFENTLGYENITDNDYTQYRTQTTRNIDLVNVHYRRKDFIEGRIIKQEEEPNGGSSSSNGALPKYNFVSAQKCLSDWATMNDRWDLKVNSFGHQFIGLYHGSDPFITNRMRSYMLRWIGNGIKDYLFILDETLDKLKEHIQIVHTELKNVISFIIRRLHRKIEDLWDDLDDLNAHENADAREAKGGGSMVVVSGSYLVVINMGRGRIYACDDSGVIFDLTANHEHRDLTLFMDGKDTVGSPFIHMQPRNFQGPDGADRQVKFLVIMSANVAETVGQQELSEIIWCLMSNGPDSELQLFTATANSVLKMVTDKLKDTDDQNSKLDHSVLMVGLDRIDHQIDQSSEMQK